MALILITDDAAFSRRMIRKAVEKAGHEAIEAGNGVECVAKVAERPPDCILLDLLMPEMDGYGVLASLRDQGLEIPVIVLSADIQASTHKQCMELGAFLMVRKPPKAPEIADAIDKALNANN